MKRLRIKNRALVLVSLILLVLSGTFYAAGWGVGRGSLWTGAEEAWAGEGDGRFTQVAVFLPAEEKKTYEEVVNFRQSLDSRLIEASLTAIYEGELYRDAFWSRGEMNLTSSRGSAQVPVFAVGGDYFFFHPLVLKDGSYIHEEDLMHDGIVLDEDTAWRLFGSTDLSGMTVTCGNRELRVAGVVALEDDFASEAARGNTAMAFVHYDFLRDTGEAAVEGYEIVLPDPVKNFGLNMMKENFGTAEGPVVEITGRLSLSGAVNVIESFGLRSMGQDGIRYPYWENALRMREDILGLCWLLAFLCGLMPAGLILVTAVRGLCRGIQAGAGKLREKGGDALEEHREKRYQKQQEEKQKTPAEEGPTWQA